MTQGRPSAANGPTEGGLRGPAGPVLGAVERPRRATLRLAFQFAGFLIGLALLGWAIAMALAPENRAGLEQLRAASGGQVAGLLGLAAASLLLNGLIFWVTAIPLRRLPAPEVIAVNALATLLAFLPFKLSVLARVMIHRRRDRLPYRVLLAWLAATAGLSLGVLVVLLGASLWTHRLDALWIAAVLVGAAGVVACAWVAGRAAARWPRLDGLTLGAGAVARCSPVVGAHVALRLADVAAQAGRFAIVAKMLGQPLAFDGAIILASVYFFVGVVSPAGNLGVREGAVFGLGYVLSSLELGPAALAQVVLVVTAGEAVTQLALGLLAGLWLRPDRLLAGRTGVSAPAAPPV